MSLEQSLAKFGLNRTESKVYTFLLEKPKRNTVFEIARGIKIPRSTVYLALDGLEEKQLVVRHKQNNVLHFLAESPTRLTQQANEKLNLLNMLVPQLLSLQSIDEKQPSVKAYSGHEGVRIVFDDIYDRPNLQGVREFHNISNPKLLKYLPKYLPKKIEYKKSLNITTKLIVVQNTTGSLPPEYRDDSHREIRLLPRGVVFDGTMIIYGKKVALFSHKESEVYSVILESEPISHMLDSVFLLLWDLIKGTTRRPP